MHDKQPKGDRVPAGMRKKKSTRSSPCSPAGVLGTSVKWKTLWLLLFVLCPFSVSHIPASVPGFGRETSYWLWCRQLNGVNEVQTSVIISLAAWREMKGQPQPFVIFSVWRWMLMRQSQLEQAPLCIAWGLHQMLPSSPDFQAQRGHLK